MCDESLSAECCTRGRARGTVTSSDTTALRDRPTLQPIEALCSNIWRAHADVVLRTRPDSVTRKSGEGGKSVRLLANYFRLCSQREITIYDYRVDFEPNVESREERKAMLYKHKQSFGEYMVFDGMFNVKSSVLLPREENEFFSTRRSDNANIRIIVRSVSEIPWHHNEMMRLYNTQMRRNFQLLEWNLIGRHYFNSQLRYAIPEHRLDVLQGLRTAINRYDDANILMVCDTLFKVIRTDSVLQQMRDILSRDTVCYELNARKEIVGQVIITEYNNNNVYRIDDIVFDKNPLTTTFDHRNYGQITLKDYYQRKYGISITDDKQPLLIALPRVYQVRAHHTSITYLIPELCKLTGLSESHRNDFNVMLALGQKVPIDANSRVDCLNSFMQSLNSNPQITQEISALNLEFSLSLVELSARVMDCEKIVMSDNFCTEFNQKTGDFGKEIRLKPMFAGISITDWVVIVPSQIERNIIDNFLNSLNRVCRSIDVRLNRPQVRVINNDSIACYLNACRSIPQSTQIVVVILSDDNKERYDTIKTNFCCDQPIASQMVVMKTIEKKQMLLSVCNRIGIQMATKLGAQPWAVEIRLKDVMIVGFNVHKDRTQWNKCVGGFVCSTNQTFTKWYSRVSFSSGQEEFFNNFSLNFQEGIKRYHEINKKLPSIIIVYRDGVPEREIEHVYHYELKLIQNGIENTCKESAQTIKLTFIIVNKYTNSRFFLKVDETYDNPEPGTVVDTVVTREERYDFYLTSQSRRKGTVEPVLYNIIKDDTNWLPQQHQQLAYKLCHLCYNWMGTMRSPAPCYYAHKLAYLTATVLHRSPHISLSDTLFYL